MFCLETTASSALSISVNPTTSKAAIDPPNTAPSAETAMIEGKDESAVCAVESFMTVARRSPGSWSWMVDRQFATQYAPVDPTPGHRYKLDADLDSGFIALRAAIVRSQIDEGSTDRHRMAIACGIRSLSPVYRTLFVRAQGYSRR